MANNSDKKSRQQRAEQMRKERERADKRRRSGITVGIVVVVLALIAVAAFAIANQVGKNNEPATAPGNVTDDGGVVYDQEAATGTAAGSEAVKVVIYEDFQCPVCRAFESELGPFLDQSVESGDIAIEYRPVAYLDNQSSTEYSTRSLNAAACVVDDGGPKAFHDLQKLLYTNQPEEGGDGLPDDQLADLAQEAGATGAASCIEDGTYEKWVEETTNRASDAGVDGTPTVMVDGKNLANSQGGPPSQEQLQKAIAAAAK